MRFAYLVGIVLIAYPGMISAINDPNGGGDYLWTDKYPDDTARYRSGNAALMNVVDGLQIWIDRASRRKAGRRRAGRGSAAVLLPASGHSRGRRADAARSA